MLAGPPPNFEITIILAICHFSSTTFNHTIFNISVCASETMIISYNQKGGFLKIVTTIVNTKYEINGPTPCQNESQVQSQVPTEQS